MVCHVITGNELYGFACAFNQKVAGHAQFGQDAEKGVFCWVDLVGKQVFYGVMTIFKRGEGDVV